MFCSNCGKEVNDKAVVCVGCGVPVKKEHKISGGQSGAGILKFNWIFSLIAIVSFALAVVFSVASLGDNTYGDFYLSLPGWGIAFLLIFSIVSLFSGVTCFIISMYNKEENKFNSILAFSLSICCFLFMIMALICLA